MGATKLCLLLLLGTYTLAQQDVGSDQSPACNLARRFKTFRRYSFAYTVETANGVAGATNDKTGAKLSCAVEVDVPQACSFIIRTKQCVLSPSSGVDDNGEIQYSDDHLPTDLELDMARNPLKVVVEGQTTVDLFPEDDEPANILNIKRGIVSALLAPEREEDETDKEMPTVHGICPSDLAVSTQTDVNTDVIVTRDLSKCDQFTARRQNTSPLALISGLNLPLSKLISSNQNCVYSFETQKRAISAIKCTERHLFLPMSREGEHGIFAEVKQQVLLMGTSKINDRVFEQKVENLKPLPMEVVDEMAFVQNKDAVIDALQELNRLAGTADGEERPKIFHKLVSEFRVLKADVLDPATDEMMRISMPLTIQALVQCGTPTCTSALLRFLRTFDDSALEVDATVYAMGMLSAPSRLMVKDLLEMAKYKKSKPIMFALSKAVRKLYQGEGSTPEIANVYEFMSSILGADCAGDKDLTYLALRVVGNMGDAMEGTNPEIKDTLLKCMRQPSTTLSVQLAAIQAFRRMTVTGEDRSNLQRVSQYPKGAVQKRLAAYLVLMRNPQDTDVEMVKKLIKQEQNPQVKAFVTSHVYNIISSKAPEVRMFADKILTALQDTEVKSHNEVTTKSGSYKLGLGQDSFEGAVQGNVIFDPSNRMPRELMLETTLRAFGFNVDIWEVGMEGKGFEPTIETLFGKNGFFPDTVSKAIYWAEDKMPPKMNEVLQKWAAPFKTEGQRVPENLGKEIVRNFNKLVKDLQSQESPESMAYLRIMGDELGYIKGSDLRFIADNAIMYADILMRILPSTVLGKFLSGTNNEFFAHYIFMDNKFMMPTAAGFPLTFTLSGTFTPGLKGGLHFARNMKEMSFMPSIGVGFVTKMGVSLPGHDMSAVEMHTTLYHESGLNAKVTMERSQIKLSIPAPQGTTKFLRINNKVNVGNSQASMIAPQIGDKICKPLFSGLKYCTEMIRADPDGRTDTPYFPLKGQTMYAVNILPTKDVTEYTATIAYELLSDGQDGLERVESLNLALRAEGDQPSEATATMKYNWDKNVLTTQVQIPDFDVEAGVKVSMTDNSARGKALVLEISNKNIPQLSLIGRAKLQAMTDGLLQIQLLVPSLDSDAAITATVSKIDGLTLELKSEVKLSESSSLQSVIFKYDEEQAEVQLVSKMNADTTFMVDYTEAAQAWFRQFLEDVMDQQVVKTDMKLRHILNKGVEAGNIWMDKIATDIPYVETLRNKVADMEIPPMPSMPENLFMNLESKFKYQFNQDRVTITLPMPLGGKSSEELRIPSVVTSPEVSLPQVGVWIAPQQVQIPAFTIASEYDLTLPLMGFVEVSAKVTSNYYNWEATVSAGNSTVESPTYQTQFSIMADSPIKVLAFTTEGAAKITDTAEKTMKFTLDGSMKHMFMKTGFNVLETIAVTDNVLSTGRYNIYASSPMGLDTTLTITTQITLDSTILSGDLNTDGSISVGPMTASTTYLHTFSVEPAKKEARLESTLKVTSEILKVSNKIKASYANQELLIESNTNMNSNPIKHTTKMSLKYQDVKLTIMYDSVTKADDRMLRSQLELSSSNGQASLRIENQADDTENRAYTLITGSVTPSGLEVNTDASLNVFSSLASHKATFSLNSNGLTTTCTTTGQRSPMTFENVFNGVIDTSGATMSLTTKGAIKENKAELIVEGKIATTEVSFNGMFKGNLYEIDARNRVNFKVNEDGLNLSNNMVGSFNDIRTENTHSLSLALRSLSLRSKTDNVLDRSNSYMHDISVTVEPYTASAIAKNDLKIMEVNFVNDAQFKAEPYKVELTGTVMGVYSEEQLKHTYEIKFVDRALSAKCNTNGKLLGSHMTHTADMEITGLTMKFNDVTNINSPSLRLDSTVKTFVEPFTLTVDAILNSDGSVNLYGKQSGEVYSKFLLKAEPLRFTQSFEYRASTTHELKDIAPIITNVDNKFDSMFSLDEQTVTLKMKSKVNNHAFDEEIKAYNNMNDMGIEMTGVLSTSLLSEPSQDYSVSGFVKYDKNSENHFILVPFVEHLPAVIENVKTTVMRLMDQGIEMLKDVDSKYKISDQLQNKVSQLKEVIDNFDLNLFVQDLRKYLSSVQIAVANMMDKFPTDKVMNVVKSIREAIMAWIKKYNIANKFNTLYAKIEEILSSYEVEKVIEAIMDEIVKIMKQYQVREKIQSAFAALRSIDLQPLLKKALAPVQELVNEVYSFDYKQMIDDVSDYFIQIIQKIKSFDYDTFTIELKETMVDMARIPCFGKLYGEFRFSSPHYQLKTSADMGNTTTSSVTPEFKMNFNSRATSTLKILDYNVDATAHIAAPERSRLSITENINVDSSCFTLDHEGTMTIFGLSVQASADTTAKFMTELYTAEMLNKALFTTENGVSATAETNYKHNLNMPPLRIFTEALMNQKTVFQIEDGTVRLIIKNLANEKHAVRDYSDEGTHKSDVEVILDLHTSKVTFTGETSCGTFKMSHNVVADLCVFRHAIIEAKVETEAPFMKGSVAEAKFQAKVEDMKIDFTASHNAELIGLAEGTLSTSALALITPNELVIDTQNKGYAKIALPFKLSGKVDLQNDIALTLNSEVQQASWTGLARFNQYKYSHSVNMVNKDEEIEMFYQINGEANLDMLKETITIPEIRVPYVGRSLPRIKSFSLWENTGLRFFLITTQQTIDMSSKMTYKKNPEVITIDVNLEPVFNAINTNVKTLHKKVLTGKDRAADILASTYNKAKADYDKYSMELPKTITVPAYKVPVMNIEMSSFTIPVPDSSLIKMPTMHVPSALSKMTLPKITLPKMQTIKIPMMGDLTYEFSLKTAVITLKTDASILNKDNIIMRLDASSTSEFEILSMKIQGNSNVNTAGGLKMGSSLLMKHPLLEANHDSTINLSYDNVDNSITNFAKFLVRGRPTFKQEITMNSEDGLVVSMTDPSKATVAVQVQLERPAQIQARLYGRYPSEPKTDVDVLGVTVSLVGSEKPLIQTTSNMEMPTEVIKAVGKGLQEALRDVAKMLSEIAMFFKWEAERTVKEGKAMYKRAVERFPDAKDEFITAVADNARVILEEYKKRVQPVLEAVLRVLEETTFQIPGYEQRLTGLEVYDEFCKFVMSVFEEAVERIPKYFGDLVSSVEFTLPGSQYTLSGKAVVNDVSRVMKRSWDGAVTLARKLANMNVEDVVNKISEFTQIMFEQSKKFLQTLNLEKVSDFVTAVYNDVINCPHLTAVYEWILEQWRVFVEYLEHITPYNPSVL